MRKLVFIKGPPGAGKSTLASDMGWEPYTLNMDTIRLLRRAPELNSKGLIGISNEENKSVYSEWISLLSKRMERGEFIVLDAIFNHYPKDVMDMVKENRYDCVCVDMSKVPLQKIIEQNDNRIGYKRVARSAIEKIWHSLNQQKPWDIKTIDWKEDGSHKDILRSWAQVPLYDFSSYKNIVHIGDLQGCLTVLTGPGGVLEDGFDDDNLYIFVGDLLDRGIENGKVLKWFLEECVDRDNVILIWGNHEDHLHRWSIGADAVSDEFAYKTLPQLKEEGIRREDARRVCDKAIEVLLYSYNSQRVMVCHAGLPTVPAHPELISLKQYSKGTGFWSDPIDEQFERNAPSDWIQVHGHRNHGWQEIRARPRSFNLEDQVEFGGRLRWAILNKDGWMTGSNINTVYDLEGSSKIKKKKINWKNKGTILSEETLNNLREHNGVKEKIMEEDNHISSFNFTPNVFYNSSWDDLLVKARGLFVNHHTNEIIARGYDKFFNINEKPQTKMSQLTKNLQFPIVAYLKENGFLGNLGFDSQTKSLFIATKSTNKGDFCTYFKNILNEKMSPSKQEGLARWLRDNEACMTFEVIDPVNDPHMVDYDESRLILLDVFHRNESGQRLPFVDLVEVAKKFDLEVKQRSFAFQNSKAFEGWYNSVANDLKWRYKGDDIEGFVFEDANGEMVKIKMASYAFWKKMRGQKDRMRKEWEKTVERGLAKNRKLEKIPQNRAPLWNEQDARLDFQRSWEERGENIHPAAKEFLSWCSTLSSENWSKSILELRKEFLKRDLDATIWDEPFFQDPAEKEEYEIKKNESRSCSKSMKL